MLTVVLSTAAYLVIGSLVLWIGRWNDRISSLTLRLRLLSTLQSGQDGDRNVRWRILIGAVILWIGALAIWPLSLWTWGRTGWRGWSARRKRRRQLWGKSRHVSTCPPKLSVAFRERTGQTAVVGFDADEALGVLERFTAQHPHLLNGDYGEAVAWLKSRDKSASETGYRRSRWRPIETAAIELMKLGRCKVKCCACDHVYEGSEIFFEPWESWIPASGSFHGGGGAGENFTCPKGHLLHENITAMA